MGFEIQVMAHKCGGIKSVNGTLTLMWQLSPQRKYKHKQTIKHIEENFVWQSVFSFATPCELLSGFEWISIAILLYIRHFMWSWVIPFST